MLDEKNERTKYDSGWRRRFDVQMGVVPGDQCRHGPCRVPLKARLLCAILPR